MNVNKSKLKVIHLGGLQEIGKNISIIEYDSDIIIIDCGVSFPDNEMLGIDLVIPDFNYLVKNKDRIKGLVLTHGHEDHIGAVPYFLKQLNVPLYGTALTLGLVENKLKEHNLMNSSKRIVVNQSSSIKIGCFEVEFIRTTHSIADSSSLAIHTPVGVIIHSGDFKIDYTPVKGETIDLQRFAELGKKGVLLFMCESTNIEQEGYTMSESSLEPIFKDLFL